MILKKLKNKIAQKSWSWLADSQPKSGYLWNPHAAPIRESDACANSIVMACVLWAMRNVGQATPIVQTRGKSGWERVPGHAVEELLRRPQGMIHQAERTFLTGRKLLGAMTYSRMLDGNAYAVKVRNAAGYVIGLDWVPHGAIRAVADLHQAGRVSHYELSGPGGITRLDRHDVIHDRDGIDPANPLRGIGRLASVMRHIQTDNQIAAYSQSLLANPVPSLLVSAKSDSVRISQNDAEYIAQKMREASGRDRAGGIVVPNFPAEVTPIGFSPDDLAISQLNRLPEERITAIFGIPAVVLGLGAGLDRSTYSNMREAREAATEEFLVPLWQDLAGTMTEQLLPEFGDRGEMRVWFDMSEVGTLQEDRTGLHDRVRSDFLAGLVDREAARAQLGLG